MKKLLKNLSVILVVVVVTLFTACSKRETTNTTAEGNQVATTQTETSVNLTISAAASLKDAMNEIQELYKNEKSNVTLSFNFDSSGTLQKQIEQGAPVDIFLSAGKKQLDALKTKELIIEDTYKNLLKNEVVLVVPKDSAKSIEFNKLTDESIKNIGLGNPGSVPAGQYGEEVLTYLKIYDKINTKIVLAKDVREVLAWVETGNVDAGIVYKTDAQISDKVKVAAEAPQGSHKAIVYPGAVIKASKNVDASKEFLQFLSKEEVSRVFEKYGFNVVE